jgi:hypothetical protein
MSYLIDTCAIIDLLTGKLSKMARDWLASNAEAGLTKTSAVVYYELLFGSNTPKTKRIVEDLLRDWTILPVDQTVASRAATIRRLSKAKGETIGMADALIAATAQLHELKIVTSDLRGFPKDKSLNLRDLDENNTNATIKVYQFSRQ